MTPSSLGDSSLGDSTLAPSSNPTIAKLQTDVSSFQSDFGNMVNAQNAFVSAVKTYIAAQQAAGTTLSAADQANLNAIDSAIASLDSTTQTVQQSVNGISVP